MAEFCLNCHNKMMGTTDMPNKYIISKTLHLCEGCGEFKNIVIAKRKYYYRYKLRFFILPIKFIYNIFCIPYVIYKYKKSKS